MCKLNRNQRFRLCSVVHQAFVGTKIAAHKLLFNKSDSCVAQKTILLKEMFEKPDKYHKKDVRVNALPCFMLNEDGTTGTLYVTHDPQESNSVFLFVLGPEYVMKGMSMLSRFHIMRAHVRNATVLNHAKYFY